MLYMYTMLIRRWSKSVYIASDERLLAMISTIRAILLGTGCVIPYSRMFAVIIVCDLQ